VRVGRFVLIAKNVKNFRVLARLNKAIAAISPQMELDIIARLGVFNGKLLFNLSHSHTHDHRNPANG
jgi:hypothetical protein